MIFAQHFEKQQFGYHEYFKENQVGANVNEM